VLVTPTSSVGGRAGFVNRLNRVPTPATEPKAINSRTLYKAGKALDELPVIVPKGTPNFTIQPAKVVDPDILGTHLADEVTGVFVNAA
ncbi:hypothetical protein, partial [Streptococcus pneumoniae]|uniref:hypothetical protein n=1 Tax=Streptococcus pneumoniae TaxID=1313 RepID=UPI0018B0CC63